MTAIRHVAGLTGSGVAGGLRPRLPLGIGRLHRQVVHRRNAISDVVAAELMAGRAEGRVRERRRQSVLVAIAAPAHRKDRAIAHMAHRAGHAIVGSRARRQRQRAWANGSQQVAGTIGNGRVAIRAADVLLLPQAIGEDGVRGGDAVPRALPLSVLVGMTRRARRRRRQRADAAQWREPLAEMRRPRRRWGLPDDRTRDGRDSDAEDGTHDTSKNAAPSHQGAPALATTGALHRRRTRPSGSPGDQ